MMKRFLLTTTALLAFGCQPGDAVPTKPAGPFVPSLSLRPVSITLAREATQTFQVEINYPEGVRYMRQPVAWVVVEPEGGTITLAGVYTAPAVPGTFHVQVKREDFPEVMATATVTVK